MKKKFIPAYLTEWKDRWMIIFHAVDPKTNERKRFRRSFGMNRIGSKSERKKRAKEIINELNHELLPMGYPFVKSEEGRKRMEVVAALNHSVSLKHTGRKSSIDTYRYVTNHLIEYVILKGKQGMDIGIIDSKFAIDFLDYLSIDRKLKNVTRNGIANALRTLFNELKERELVSDNPFAHFKKLPEEEKERRPLTQKEKKILSEYIKEKDRELYLAVIIMYYCFIRKIELLRLKFRYFDFVEGVIRLPGEKSKNKKSEILTMPKKLAKILISEYGFDKQPQHWNVFSTDLKPGNVQGPRNAMSTRHRKLVDELAKKRILVDPKSIHFYSWKDTGAHNMLLKGLSITDLQKQLRHTSLDTTKRYLKGFSDVNERISDMDVDV